MYVHHYHPPTLHSKTIKTISRQTTSAIFAINIVLLTNLLLLSQINRSAPSNFKSFKRQYEICGW